MRQYKSVVLDEGTELLSRETMNVTNRVLTKTFFVQRALGFLVITNIPNFHMLDPVLRNHRVRTLIEVIDRGKYKCITGLGINIVAREGMPTKTVNNVRIPNGTFWNGYFSKEFPKTLDREAYEKYKIKSIKELLASLNQDILQKKMIPVCKVAKEIGYSRQSLIDKIKSKDIAGKQIGSKWFISMEEYDRLTSI